MWVGFPLKGKKRKKENRSFIIGLIVTHMDATVVMFHDPLQGLQTPRRNQSSHHFLFLTFICFRNTSLCVVTSDRGAPAVCVVISDPGAPAVCVVTSDPGGSGWHHKT